MDKVSLYLRSAALMRRWRSTSQSLGPPEKALLGTALYNEACAYALAGQATRALDSLAEARTLIPLTTNGPDLDADPDLDSLRALPRFQALRAEEEQAAAQRTREQARAELARWKSFPFSFPSPLHDLDGRIITPADFRGKVTVVNIWATDCIPCRKALPPLIDLARRYHDRGLEVIGINIEGVPEESARRTVRAFVEAHGLPYRCLIGSRAAIRSLLSQFAGIPTTLFLDRAGNVRLAAIGYRPVRDLEAVAGLLLAEGPVEAAAAPLRTPAAGTLAGPKRN
jgi:thiol-disulfide isomerase/thioredoxin